MKVFLLLFIACLAFSTCKKNKIVNSCSTEEPVKAIPFIGEMVGDSAIITDTAFTGTIVFQAKGSYKEFYWKVGNDTRKFTSQKFNLRFDTPLPLISVGLFVADYPNTACFPNDDGRDSSFRSLTVLPRDSNARSPLIGEYSGYIKGKESDTFRVKVDFWSNKKYSSVLGPQPFYTISNFPKGYRDTTSSIGTQFKELSYGYVCDWGYRAIYIYEDYKEAQHTKGYVYLSNRDTLKIDNSRADITAPFDPQTGYPRLKETFIGIRKK